MLQPRRDQCVGFRGGGNVVPRHHMRVDLERHPDVCMAEPLRYNLLTCTPDASAAVA